MNERCAACRREAAASILEPVISVLDFEICDLCPACVDSNAEPIIAVIRTTNSAGWRQLPGEIRRSIRVFDMDEYVTVPVWAKRMSERQLVVAEKPKEPDLDPDDTAVLRRMREIHNRMKRPVRPPRRSNWMVAFITFFVPGRLA